MSDPEADDDEVIVIVNPSSSSSSSSGKKKKLENFMRFQVKLMEIPFMKSSTL
jgi:hypothetical protein